MLFRTYVINPATNKIVHTITGIEAPLFIVCDDKIPRCFATDWNYGTVTPSSPTKLTVGTPVKQCNRNPEFLAFNPVNGEVYVTNINSNPPTVTVIKGTAVVKTVHLNAVYRAVWMRLKLADTDILERHFSEQDKRKKKSN